MIEVTSFPALCFQTSALLCMKKISTHITNDIQSYIIRVRLIQKFISLSLLKS